MIKINSNKLKEIIQLAKEAVKDESEPYKTEAFKIIVNNLLNEQKITGSNNQTQSETINNKLNTLNDKLEIFAEKCGVTTEQLGDIFSIKDDSIEFIYPIHGTDPKKHIDVTICVLAAYEFLFGRDWVNSSVLAECLRSIGVKNLANFAKTLRRNDNLFRSQGTTKNKRYKLTTTEGRTTAFETIKNLVKNKAGVMHEK